MIEARFRAHTRADVIALLERGGHRQRRGERRPGRRGASAARGARALDAGGVARRATFPRCCRRTIFSSAPPRMGRVPSLGEHTSEVLAAMEPVMTMAHQVRSRAKHVVRPGGALGDDREGRGERRRRGLHRSRGLGCRPIEKAASRANVVRAFTRAGFRPTRLGCSASTALDTPFAYRDLVDVVEAAGDRIDLVMLPKAGSAARRRSSSRRC